jgi:hypothetical protein
MTEPHLRESLDNIITAAPGDHDKPYEFDAPASMLLRFDKFEWNRLHAQRDRVQATGQLLDVHLRVDG